METPTPTENQETKLTIVKVDPPEIVDPAEFGMGIKQFQLIEDAFTPTMSEAKVLFKIYDTVINSEMSLELCEEAKKARIATGKAIKKIEDTHKTQKAYFWQGGKCVDAIRNSRVKPLDQIKAGFKEIEDYYHIKELERIEKVRIKRTKDLSKYTDEIPEDVGAMRPTIYENYFAGAKAIHGANIASEKKAKEEKLEKEKLAVLLTDRKDQMLIAGFSFNGSSYAAGSVEVAEDERISKMNDVDFEGFIKSGKAEVKRLADIQEEQKKENDRLKEKADEKVKLDARSKERQQQLIDIGLTYDGEQFCHKDVNFHHTELITMSDSEFAKAYQVAKARMEEIKSEEEKELAKLEEKVKEEKAEREKAAIKCLVELGYQKTPDGYNISKDWCSGFIGSKHYSDLESDKELSMFVKEQKAYVEGQKAKAKQKEAVAELQAKNATDALKEKQDQDKIQADLNKDDAAKITDLIDDLDTLMTKYSFESERNQVKYAGVKNLLLKVVLYIKE